ncbi:hypothetical protein YC2023_058933 [Brassica napus]
MDETTFKRSEADLDQAAGTVDKEARNVLKTYMRNGVEMAKVEYSTLFQDKKKKTKRLQESVSSDRIRPQPPSEKLEETKSLELMDNVDAYHNDGWCISGWSSILKNLNFFGLVTQDRNMMRDSIPELLALPEFKHPIGSEPKPKNLKDVYGTCYQAAERTLKDVQFLEGFEHVLECLPDCFCRSHGSHTSPLSQQVETQDSLPENSILKNLNFFGLVTQDRIMMRDSIPELLALPELKHPIGSEPKPKVTINQYSTAAYIKTGPPIIKPEESHWMDHMHLHCLNRLTLRFILLTRHNMYIEKEPSNQTHAAQTQFFSTNVTQQEPLNESPASPLSQQIETQKQCLEALVHIHDDLPDFLQIEKEQLDEAPDAHTQVFSPNVTQQKEIEPSLDEMPSNPNRGEENLDVEVIFILETIIEFGRVTIGIYIIVNMLYKL